MLNTGLHELLPKYIGTYSNTHYGLAPSYRTDAYVFCIPYNNKKWLMAINLTMACKIEKITYKTDICVEVDMVWNNCWNITYLSKSESCLCTYVHKQLTYGYHNSVWFSSFSIPLLSNHKHLRPVYSCQGHRTREGKGGHGLPHFL